MDGDLSWHVGTAAVDITPKESMWLAGWAARREPASGTATPLYAKALAIRDEAETTLIICTVDLIAVTREIVEPVSTRVLELYGIRREQLLFNASHTHTGPEIRPEKALFFHIPDEYVRKIVPYREWLIEQMITVIGQALGSMQAAALFATSTTCEIAENRRKPPGPVDYDVPVLYARNAHGNIVAAVVGYACHNLTLPPTFVQYCAEYCGASGFYIEMIHHAAETFFLSGAGADIDPRKQPAHEMKWYTPAAADPGQELGRTFATGYELGHAVVQALEGTAPRQLCGPLRVAYTETTLDFEPLPSRTQLDADLECDDPPRRVKARYLLDCMESGTDLPSTYHCPLQAVSFGPELLLIAMSAEPVVQFALDFKKQYGPGLVWVAGYCNDMFGYIATREVQEQGGYEGGRAFLWTALPGPFTRDTEKRVRAAVDELVNRVRSNSDVG
jgi:hypothetical protein